MPNSLETEYTDGQTAEEILQIEKCTSALSAILTAIRNSSKEITCAKCCFNNSKSAVKAKVGGDLRHLFVRGRCSKICNKSR